MSRLAALLLVVLSVSLPACSMLGGGDDHERGRRQQGAGRNVSMNADCERLAPYVVNADGSLSKPDLEVGLKGDFKKWDKNSDGQLSQAEVQPLNDYLRSLKVNASPVMDWNGDGHVTYDEFASGWRTMFDLCARGDSDIVTKADLQRSPAVAPPRKADDGNKRPEGASSPNTGGGGY